MSSIITTKRNSTITAPTYTSTSTMPRNSAFISSQMAAEDTKVSTSASALCTGLRAVITRVAAPTVTSEKTKNKTVVTSMLPTVLAQR